MLDALSQFQYNSFAKKYKRSQNCDCYKCTEPEYDEHNGHEFVVNNMEHHTFLEPCDECGRPRTEYHDLGRKGRFICGWCRGNLEEPEAAILQSEGL